MADVGPFRALRYSTHLDLSAVLGPPYDVITPAYRETLYARHPNNIARIDLGDDREGDTVDENKYTRASQWLREWRQSGVLTIDVESALYLYQQEFVDRTGSRLCRTGLVGAMRLEDFNAGGVKPHEHTKEAPKLDRLRLTRATRANLSSIFALCDDSSGRFDELLARAILDARPTLATGDDGVIHRLWRITGDLTRQLRETLAPCVLFIADGHHRYETSLAYREERRAAAARWSGDEPENFTLMTIVSVRDPGLVVFPTHRLLRFDGAMSTENLCATLEPYFEWELVDCVGRLRLGEQLSPHVFGLLVGDSGARIRLRNVGQVRAWLDPQHSEDYNALEVTIAHRVLIDQLLVAAGVARDSISIEYTADSGEAVARVESGEFQCAVLLPATRIHQVLAIANAGEKMPAKSTYFHPKLITGMVMRAFDD